MPPAEGQPLGGGEAASWRFRLRRGQTPSRQRPQDRRAPRNEGLRQRSGDGLMRKPPEACVPSRLLKGIIAHSDGIRIDGDLTLPLAILEPISAALCQPAIGLVGRNPAEAPRRVAIMTLERLKSERNSVRSPASKSGSITHASGSARRATMARLTDEIENGKRIVHVENEDEFYYYSDRGPITLSRELAESLGFREYPGSAEELDVEEWEETLKGEREWEELQKEWAEEEWRAEHPIEPSSPFSRQCDRPASAVIIPFPNRVR